MGYKPSELGRSLPGWPTLGRSVKVSLRPPYMRLKSRIQKVARILSSRHVNIPSEKRCYSQGYELTGALTPWQNLSDPAPQSSSCRDSNRSSILVVPWWCGTFLCVAVTAKVTSLGPFDLQATYFPLWSWDSAWSLVEMEQAEAGGMASLCMLELSPSYSRVSTLRGDQ